MQADIPMSSPRQTTVNEDTQQRNGEDGISPKIEDRTDSMHIHVAGRVLTPALLGMESMVVIGYSRKEF